MMKFHCIQCKCLRVLVFRLWIWPQLQRKPLNDRSTTSEVPKTKLRVKLICDLRSFNTMSFFVEYIVRNSSYKETMFIYMGLFKDIFRTTWLKGIIWISGKIGGKRHTSLVNTTGVVVTINETHSRIVMIRSSSCAMNRIEFVFRKSKIHVIVIPKVKHLFSFFS